jgi:hypothetical protein
MSLPPYLAGWWWWRRWRVCADARSGPGYMLAPPVRGGGMEMADLIVEGDTY